MEKMQEEMREAIPAGFTWKMALVDAIPVLEFSVSMIAVASRFRNALFAIGACCSTLAGCGKVLWKTLLAAKKKNVTWLNRQFRYLMSGGFMMMAASVFTARKRIPWRKLRQKVFSLPAAGFFGLGVIGMGAMGLMGAKLDKNNARHNWIEQITNLISQGLLMAGILFSCREDGKDRERGVLAK